MPEWSPPWADVPYSGAAAGAVTDAAAALDRVIESSLASVVALAHDARVDWTGPHLREFEDRYPHAMRDLHEVRDALHDLRRRVAIVGAAASAEQNRREALRAEWRVERAAEMVTATASVR